MRVCLDCLLSQLYTLELAGISALELVNVHFVNIVHQTDKSQILHTSQPASTNQPSPIAFSYDIKIH